MRSAIRADVSQTHHILLLKPSKRPQKPRSLDMPNGNHKDSDSRWGDEREGFKAHGDICLRIGARFCGKLVKSTGRWALALDSP